MHSSLENPDRHAPDAEEQSRIVSWRRNPFFPLCAAIGVAFVVTVLSLVVLPFADPRSPVNQFLDRHAAKLILVEVAGILISGALAHRVDRAQMMQNWKDRQRDVAPPP